MANTYTPVEMDIGSNRSVLINIRSDVASYFGITAATTGGNAAITRTRKAHTRKNFSGVDDTTGTDVSVGAATWQTVQKVADLGSGKRVKIPTKLTSGPNDNIRFTSFRVPGNANIGAISNFLYEKCDAAKRPSYFVMESGAKYPVVQFTGDVNPGESDSTTP